MTAVLLPNGKQQFFTTPGVPAVGYKLATFAAGTVANQTTWQDAGKIAANTNPIILDARGEAVIFWDGAYKVQLQDSTGAPIWTVDNVSSSQAPSANFIPTSDNAFTLGSVAFSWANIYLGSGDAAAYNTVSGNIGYYKQTVSEAAASVVPTDFTYPPGNLLRYGIVPNSFATATANTSAMQALMNPNFPAGPQGVFVFPNTTGADVYYFNGVIPCRGNVHIDAQGCTLSLGQAGTPAVGISTDTDSGFFMAANDFSFVNGTINIFWSTGPSTSSGNAFWLGFRGSDSPRWPFNPVYDSLLTIRQGNFYIENVRINSTVTGANVAGAAAIAMTGGLTNVDIRNIFITGTGNGGTPFGLQYEFGWATSGTVGDTGQSSRQTSHMHDAQFKNINVTNLDNLGAGSSAMLLTGAYGVSVDGLDGSGVSNVFLGNTGEAMNFRPWAGVDDSGVKQGYTLRNITGSNFSNSGVTIDGTYKRQAGSSYLQFAWVPTTAYVLNQTVINGGNMYQCTAAGNSAGAGGPTGTGSGIVDGSVTWAYVTLRANTDLIHFSIDGFALSGNANSTGIFSGAAFAKISNGLATSCKIGVLISEECTRFSLDGVKITDNGGVGIQADFTASAIWVPARLKKGVIKNCYIAGNSTSSAGTSGGIQIKNFDGVTIENTRFGYESAYSFVDEAFQAQAIFLSAATNCANLRVRGCRVGGAVGGIGFLNNSSSSNQGNIVENCSFNAGGANPITTPVSGALMTDFESATSPVIVNGNTIITNGVKTARVNPGGAVTGIILQPGSYQGQEITVINEAGPANSVTMAAAGTSHVADGVSSVIAGATARKFVWDVSFAGWFANK